MTSLILIFVDLLIAMVIPSTIVLGLTYINRNTKKILVNNYGFNSQVYFGFLGIIVHETSHMLAALLFGHQIVEFKPLVLPKNVARNGGALGYVNQRWNTNSTYQNIGNLFIGTAPIWGCTFVLYLLTKLTMPNLYQFILKLEKAMATMNLDSIRSVISNMNLFNNIDGISLLISVFGLILMTNIVIGGFDLSSNELNNALGAFIAFYIFFTVILSALVFFGFGVQVNNFLVKLMATFVSIMGLSIFLSLLINLILRFFNFLSRFRD